QATPGRAKAPAVKKELATQSQHPPVNKALPNPLQGTRRKAQPPKPGQPAAKRPRRRLQFHQSPQAPIKRVRRERPRLRSPQARSPQPHRSPPAVNPPRQSVAPPRRKPLEGSWNESWLPQRSARPLQAETQFRADARARADRGE